MVKVTAAEVNKLRKATGAGMMDCKNALVEAEGNFDKAIEVLRKKGQKVAAKRADRESTEGAAVAKINEVALNFDSKEAFLAADFGGMTVADKLIEQTGVVGEKLEIGGFEKLEAPYVGSYVHINKIAALVGLSAKVDKADVLVKDIAMQVASMGATTLSYKDFDAAFIASETKAEADAKAELKAEGKPEQIWDRILPGKMERFISDNTTLDQEQCLLDQNFIKDEKINVAKYVESYGDVTVTSFKRVSLG